VSVPTSVQTSETPAGRDAASAGAPMPALSVVIVQFAGGGVVDRTLGALDSQRGDRVEVIVAHRSHEGPTTSQQARYPWVHWVDGGEGASPARLRAAAVRAGRGALIACTEDHCVPEPHWCERILASHTQRSAVIGGAIDKAEPAGALEWAVYLLDYGRYMPPFPAGPSAYASDCNVSYRREDLERVAEAWRAEFHETTVHWALGAIGVATVLDPAILVRQDRQVQLTTWLAERRDHGRIFAETRVAGGSWARRVQLVATAILLPPVILWRLRRGLHARGAARRVPRHTWRPLLLAAIAWSRGELDGYLGASR
jgi:Glycosyl transferase family 2